MTPWMVSIFELVEDVEQAIRSLSQPVSERQDDFCDLKGLIAGKHCSFLLLKNAIIEAILI